MGRVRGEWERQTNQLGRFFFFFFQGNVGWLSYPRGKASDNGVVLPRPDQLHLYIMLIMEIFCYAGGIPLMLWNFL